MTGRGPAPGTSRVALDCNVLRKVVEEVCRSVRVRTMKNWLEARHCFSPLLLAQSVVKRARKDFRDGSAVPFE